MKCVHIRCSWKWDSPVFYALGSGLTQWVDFGTCLGTVTSPRNSKTLMHSSPITDWNTKLVRESVPEVVCTEKIPIKRGGWNNSQKGDSHLLVTVHEIKLMV